jgi:hypothetical protein
MRTPLPGSPGLPFQLGRAPTRGSVQILELCWKEVVDSTAVEGERVECGRRRSGRSSPRLTFLPKFGGMITCK